MVFGIIGLISILIAWKWGDWRNWRKYYPTIAFWVIGNYLYDTLAYDKPLWLYYSPMLNHTLNDLFWKFMIYPSIAMVYLYRFPKTEIITKLKYLASWIIGLSVLEWLLYVFGYFLYFNGWNIWWSVAFNFMMFPLLKLHYKSPPLAWLGAAIAGAVIILIFRLPVMSLK